jgi:hypothetical protein
MAITGGFGMTMDLERGTSRRWVIGRDGVKRWADDGLPCEPNCDRSLCGDHSPGDCDHPDCPARLRPNTELKDGHD